VTGDLEIVRLAADSPGRPTLVFLHEGLGSVALWRDFPEALARRTNCNALIYSRYGNGFSPVTATAREPSYMHDEALRVLPVLLGELEIERPVLLGHSDGASIALIYAGEHPDAVRAVVLESPHVFVEELSLRSIGAIRNEYETTPLRERMARYHTDADRTFYGWNDVWLSPQFRDWNIESYVDSLRAPVLAIQGLDDEYGTLAQLESIARRAPVCVDRLVLAHCGHAPHLERRALVETTVAAWLEPLLSS
jgi:pimeloyl-ACP methyl ester carboxylesterase